MVDSNSRSHEADERSRQSATQAESQSTSDFGVQDEPLLSYSPYLLRDTRLSTQGNTPVRSEVMQSAQQTHGNRAVQRFLNVQRTTASPVTVQRSWLSDYWDSIAGRDPVQAGERPRGHAYARTNSHDGLDAGFSGISGRGDIGGVPVGADIMSGSGHLGAWEEDGNVRHGLSGSASVAHVDVNRGGMVSLEANAGSVGADASIGDNGATLGVGASLVDAAVTVGGAPSASSDTDESVRIGAGEGLGAAGRLHWGDADHDGHREYGYGFDAGPVSMDVRTEDPLRTGMRAALQATPFTMPLGMALPYVLPEGNLTDRATTAVGSAYDTASEYGGRAYDTLSEGVDSIRDWF